MGISFPQATRFLFLFRPTSRTATCQTWQPTDLTGGDLFPRMPVVDEVTVSVGIRPHTKATQKHRFHCSKSCLFYLSFKVWRPKSTVLQPFKGWKKTWRIIVLRNQQNPGERFETARHPCFFAREPACSWQHALKLAGIDSNIPPRYCDPPSDGFIVCPSIFQAVGIPHGIFFVNSSGTSFHMKGESLCSWSIEAKPKSFSNGWKDFKDIQTYSKHLQNLAIIQTTHL